MTASSYLPSVVLTVKPWRSWRHLQRERHDCNSCDYDGAWALFWAIVNAVAAGFPDPQRLWL